MIYNDRTNEGKYLAYDADGREVMLTQPCQLCGGYGEQAHSITFGNPAIPRLCVTCKVREDGNLMMAVTSANAALDNCLPFRRNA